MALETLISSHEYFPGSAMAPEPIPFPFLSTSQLRVTHIDAAGSEALLVSDVDYTIGGSGTLSTGTITAKAAWAPADRFLVERVTEPKQKALIRPQEPFPAKAAEDQLDRLTMLLQEIRRDVDGLMERSWQVPRFADKTGQYPVVLPGGEPGFANGTGTDNGLRGDLGRDGGAGLVKLTPGATVADLAENGVAKGPALIPFTHGLAYPPGSVGNHMSRYLCVTDPPFNCKGDGITDDTPGLQAAIILAQLIKAWLYFPPTKYAYMTTGLTIGVAGTNRTCHFQGGGFDPSMAAQSGITGQYEAQSMIKLLPGSNQSLITVVADAAPPQFHNITFNGNGTAQSGTSYCIELSDAPSAAYYRYACWMENCLVASGRSGGLFIGLNRGAGYYSNSWFQYCGTSTSDAAVNVRCFDQQFKNCQIGPNPGVGMYVGAVTQIQISDSVWFMNNVALEVSAECGHLQVANSGFDSSNTYGLDIVGNGTSDGARVFVGCHWRRNSRAANNTYSDIRVDSDRRLVLVSPVFGGKETNANLVKYCIEAVATTQAPYVRMSDAVYETISGTPYATAITNSINALMLAGTRDAYLGKPAGNQSISIMINDQERLRTDAAGTKFLAKVYPPKDDGTAQASAGFYGGPGAPSNSNGANGDFYFRSDGASGSRIYFKAGGAWGAIV